MKTIQHTLLATFAAVWMTACVTDPNSPGLEYMPDMYRSPAVEAYVDYGQEPYEVGEEVARADWRAPFVGPLRTCKRNRSACAASQKARTSAA